jgi:ectoine hydroxylase-related dioxygenase (phytanoyl-CoA dioxygenase family)
MTPTTRLIDDGFVILPAAVPPAAIEALRREADRLERGALGLRESDRVYDLAESHTPARPVLHRITVWHGSPSPVLDFARDRDLLAIVSGRLGPDIRLKSAFVNMNPAAVGQGLRWHQDWAYSPHSNSDFVVVGILLDDVGDDNGPVQYVPGSHGLGLFDHHAKGYFTGLIDVDRERLDVSGAVTATGSAGTVVVHDARLVHRSLDNRSTRPRRIVWYDLLAADSWPLLGLASHYIEETGPGSAYQQYRDNIVAGAHVDQVRLEANPVKLPYPKRVAGGRAYVQQKAAEEST